MILPQIEQKNLWDTLGFNESNNWDTPDGSPNEKACGTFIQTFRCPSMTTVPKHVENQEHSRTSAIELSRRGIFDRRLRRSQHLGQRPLLRAARHGRHFFLLQPRADGGDQRRHVQHVHGRRIKGRDILAGRQPDGVLVYGSPQIDPCNCQTGKGATEQSEFVGSTGVPINARAGPSRPSAAISRSCRSAACIPMAASSYWPTAQCGTCRTTSTATYRGMGSRGMGDNCPRTSKKALRDSFRSYSFPFLKRADSLSCEFLGRWLRSWCWE